MSKYSYKLIQQQVVLFCNTRFGFIIAKAAAAILSLLRTDRNICPSTTIFFLQDVFEHEEEIQP